MYKILLRNVMTGEKHWYDDCYLNAKIEKDKIVYWNKIKHKILAWKWQGYDRTISIKKQAVINFVDTTLLSLDLPPQWREDLLELQRKGAM